MRSTADADVAYAAVLRGQATLGGREHSPGTVCNLFRASGGMVVKGGASVWVVAVVVWDGVVDGRGRTVGGGGGGHGWCVTSMEAADLSLHTRLWSTAQWSRGKILALGVSECKGSRVRIPVEPFLPKISTTKLRTA